jgi:cyclophilin family peptidyl-prolyl cis-trans isomerase
MIIIRSLLLFCFTITLIGCSGLSNLTEKKEDKVVLITTSMGEIVVDLYDETPLHKANFIKLVESNFYDSLLFHRVISSFMIQGGDPQSKGATEGVQLGNGGPGYTIPAEIQDSLFHKKGALSAARMGDNINPEKESSGSQFYIVQGKVYSKEQLDAMQNNIRRTKPNFKFTNKQVIAYTTVGGTPFLDGGYTVFGEVIYGLGVIDKIALVDKNSFDRPLTDVLMKMETIERKNLDLKKL